MPSPLDALARGLDLDATGAAMHAFAAALQPIPRSLTGDGVRATLAAVAERIPLAVHEVPTGTPVLDWTVPREWNLRAAWVKGPDGETVVDAADSPLHVVGYSVPVRARLPLAELQEHLHSLPEQPDWMPYRTSYWRETWGFCLPHRQREALPEGEYEVCIDATLEDGALTYGECFLPGETAREVLISTHVCHPSLANDNLSGIALATFLAERLAAVPRHHGYRFLFVPGTIGAITWLARNEERRGAHRPRSRRRQRRRPGRLPLQAQPARRRRDRPRRAARRSPRSASSVVDARTSCPTATTSGSTARPASTCRWARSRARRGGATPSTTPPPTT